ncbi:MAG: ABC transporter permease [Bacteroidales bacterium]|nr:ABC transporter permease [Bacteroidales bacterium]
MIKSLIRYSLRALERQKAYVLINVSGLAVGLACSLIIVLFIRYELSFDRYNEKKDRICRVILNGKIGGQELMVTSTASPIGPTMKNEFPEVENFLRINGWGETILRYGDHCFTEDAFMEADSSFFDFFSIPLVRGQKELVLNQAYTLVISVSTAKKIFGDEDPVNKMLKVGNDSTLYRVTGVMEDVPETTHFTANAIGSFMTNRRAGDDQWLSNSFNTYVLLYPKSDPEKVNERFSGMIVKYVGLLVQQYFGISMQDFLNQGNKYNMYLQNLSEIHLDPSIEQDLKPANDPKYLWIFGSIAALIIIIASINFMNLSTAQAGKRAREVGIKKVSGSTKGYLITQFLVETVILSFLALLLTILLVEITLPYFNRILGITLHVGYLSNWYTIPLMISFALVVGIIAGSYPAFYLSSFNPYMVLKGLRVRKSAHGRLRSCLVILQFSISIVLIVGTLVMYRQIRFMLNKDLGFDKENVLVIRRAAAAGDHVQSFKEAIRKIPEVINVASSTSVPGRRNNNNGYMLKGRPEKSFLLETNWVDYDYFDTWGISLSAGRFFDRSFPTDREACIVNESAVRSYSLTDPFTERFMTRDDEADEVTYIPVVGVAGDFHFESLRSNIAPYMFRFKTDDINWGYFSVRLSSGFTTATINRIEETWGSFTNHDPMQYFFAGNDVERMYKEEKQNAKLAVLFSILAILIGSLGLYGLTTFTVQQRTKEIGVRKTFGAGMGDIWYMVAKDIIVLVLISTAIAWPFIYWIADNWLRNYPYRINLQPVDFLAGCFISLFIALLTISYRTIKTALVNPSISLRYE